MLADISIEIDESFHCKTSYRNAKHTAYYIKHIVSKKFPKQRGATNRILYNSLNNEAQMIGFSIILSTTRHEDDEDDEDEDKDDAYGVGNIQTRVRNIQIPLRRTLNIIKIGSVGSCSW